MVRSMYSGVSGLRSHQTRMDTIGNNIANVNTYGFKSGRTTFRDIYYQSMKSASAPTAALGGQNPSAVGYGAQVGTVDLMMGRSTLTMTDQTMDVAVDGDGFLQVMDGSGNIYYTRAGMLNFDSAGNLVDMQGNYVLGINGDPTGRAPGSERIMVNLPNVNPTAASITQEVNGRQYTISASEATIDGNLSMNFTTDPSLADGQLIATMNSSGIIIKMHPNLTVGSFDELNQLINQAITAANGNEAHPAGDFTITYDGPPSDSPFLDEQGNAIRLSAQDLVSQDYSVKLGSIGFSTLNTVLGGITPSGKVGTKFGENFTTDNPDLGNMTVTYVGGTPEVIQFEMEIDGTTYRGVIDSEQSTSANGAFMMKAVGGDANDYFEMKRPAFSAVYGEISGWGGISDPPVAGESGVLNAVTDLGNNGVAPKAKATEPNRSVGMGGQAFALRGGTAGGPQTIADMTGIYISPNGIIVGTDSVGTEITIGRIDLATFANPAGLNQAGSTNFAVSQNSGEPQITQPGMNGSGKLVSGTLEMSNVDLSREFSDMITTQRGYQANSRIITVSDTMLEELINLKR